MLAIGRDYPDGNDFDWLRRDPAFKLACGPPIPLVGAWAALLGSAIVKQTTHAGGIVQPAVLPGMRIKAHGRCAWCMKSSR